MALTGRDVESLTTYCFAGGCVRMFQLDIEVGGLVAVGDEG